MTGKPTPFLNVRAMGSMTSGIEWLIAVSGALAALALTLSLGAFADLALYPHDNRHYFFIAERVAAGVPPHVSAFDPKATLSLLMTGAAIALGDLARLDPVWSSRAISIAVYAAATSLLGILALRMTRNCGVAALAMIFFLAFGYLASSAAVGSRPKVFIPAFMIASILFLQEGRTTLSAFFAGFVFLIWQPMLLLMGTLGVTLLVTRQGSARLVSAFGAALIPVLLYVGYFAVMGALGPMIEQEYRFPAEYMTHESGSPLAVLTGLKGIWTREFGATNVIPIVFIAALATCGWQLLRTDGLSRLLERPGWLYLWLTLLLIGGFTLYDHQGGPDLFPVLPLVALLSATFLVHLADRAGRRWSHAGRILVVAAFVYGSAAVISGRQHRIARAPGVALHDQRSIGAQVGGWVDDGRTVYAVNSAWTLALARLDNWSPYSSLFRGMRAYLSTRAGDVYVPERNGELPDIILHARGFPPGWPEWLEAHYREVTGPEHRARFMTVWELRTPEERP